nr:hypothetical protein BaRGS_002127 [Batillaria attramentaria]
MATGGVDPKSVDSRVSNFYLDDENDQGTPRNAENVDDDDLGVKAREQADLLETVMDVLEEEEGSMDRERRAIENAIHSMYTAGLDLLAEARDESLASLKDAAKVGRDALQQELIGVRDLHTALSQLASRGVTSQTSKAKLKAKVMNNTDVRRFQQRLSDGVRKNTLTHKTDGGNSSSMLEQFRSYIGRVVPASQASEPSLAEPATPEKEGADAAAASKQSSGSDLLISDVQHVDLEELIRSQNELRAVVDKLMEQMNMLQPANTLVSQNVASLNEKMASLSTEFVSSQRQTASLQREVEKLGDKGAILREDLATLQTESSALRQDLTKVTSDQSKFQQDLTSLQTENSVLRSQMVSLQDTTDALRKTAKQHEEKLNMRASSDSQATPLQKTVTELQDSLRNGTTRISQLEAQFGQWLSASYSGEGKSGTCHAILEVDLHNAYLWRASVKPAIRCHASA